MKTVYKVSSKKNSKYLKTYLGSWFRLVLVTQAYEGYSLMRIVFVAII